jgi:5-methylcytosine-specific restriction protein A
MNMGKMTNQMVAESFKVGKERFLEKISLKEAVNILETNGVNPNSAADYIYLYIHLRNGALFKRRANEYAIKYYLENIYKDNGSDALDKALISLLKHIEYWESYSGTKVIGQREIYNHYSRITKNEDTELIYPEEKNTTEGFLEGKTKTIIVNAYERNTKARDTCIAFYGLNCQVCNLNFADKYGEIGKDFIHVHHIKEIAKIKKQYEVDPINDLIPVCPNCHAMLHKKNPAYKIREIKLLIE